LIKESLTFPIVLRIFSMASTDSADMPVAKFIWKFLEIFYIVEQRQ
jgi:hypothetical protein